MYQNIQFPNHDANELRIRETYRSDHQTHIDNISNVIHNLRQNITNSANSEILVETLRIVNHDVEDVHDIEVQQGLITALCRQVCYVQNICRLDEKSNVLNIILQIISLTYQCSDKERDRSFNEIGEHLIPILLGTIESIWSHCLNDSSYNSIFFAMEIVRSCSRLQSASLEFMRDHRVMSTLEKIISEQMSEIFASLKVGALAILKNISFYAEDHRFEILERTNLIDSVLKAATRRDGDESREYASAILRNLAMAPDTKEEMVTFPGLLEAIVCLLSDQNPKTRRNAVSAIGSMSISEDNSLLMVLHGEGVVINILLRLMCYDEDYVIRRRAARALKLLSRRDTIEMLINYQGMIEALVNVAINGGNCETQIEATETLASYASHLQVTMECYGTIIHSLLKICNKSKLTSCIEIVLKAIKELTSYEENIKEMIKNQFFLPTLTSLIGKSVSTNIVLEHASFALFHLSKIPEIRSQMASKQTFAALAFIASKPRNEIQQAQIYAVGTIVNLATVPESRKCMATEMGLLKSLMQYASSTQDVSLKNDVKSAIMVLIPVL